MVSAKALLREIARTASLDALREAVAKMESQARRSRRLREERTARAPGPSREDRRKEHREATSDLRAFVEKRSEGKCEACRGEYGSVFELHHVESGGARRANQRPGSVLALCMPCHRWAHRGNLDTLRLIASSSVLDAEARRAAEYRASKVTP